MGKEFFGLLGKSKGDREHMKKEGIEKKFLKLFISISSLFISVYIEECSTQI